MTCKFCGETDLPEGAVFCNKCGKRLDLDRTCDNCGKVISEDSVYCAYCGEAVTQTIESNAQGKSKTENTGAFSDNATKSEPAKTAESNIYNIVKSVLALGLSVISLIFVFLIGMSSSYIRQGKFYIYTYFGGIYKDIRLLLVSLNPETNYLSVALYTQAAFGTLVSVLTILGVVIFSVISVSSCIRSILNKERKFYCKWALYAFMTYLVGTLILLALVNSNARLGGTGVDYDYLLEEFGGKVKLNGATLAGLITGIIFAIGNVVLMFIPRIKQLLDKKTLIGIILSFTSLILIIVLLCLTACPIIGVDIEYGGTYNYGFFHFFTFIGMLAVNKNVYDSMLDTAGFAWLAILGFVFLTIVIILLGILIIKRINGICNSNEDNYGINQYDAWLATVSVILLILSIMVPHVFVSLIERALGYNDIKEILKFNYAIPIVICVLSVVNLGVEIACYALKRKSPEKVIDSFNDSNMPDMR